LGESQNCAAFDTGPGPAIILLGLGFTTTHLARRLLCRRLTVIGVARDIARYAQLASLGLQLRTYCPGIAASLPKSSILIHTIPPLSGREEEDLRAFILAARPKRLVYISSTSVYGEQAFVNERSEPSPSEEKGRRRMEEEAWLSGHSWSTFVVRPAAIYGPGRGAHVRIREGKPPRTAGSSMVSRIHVDDLAAILEAGLLSGLDGAWPCADDEPCSTDVITQWCAALLKMKIQPSSERLPVTGRTVDGSRLRRLLGVKLQFPGYQAGILASIHSEIR